MRAACLLLSLGWLLAACGGAAPVPRADASGPDARGAADAADDGDAGPAHADGDRDGGPAPPDAPPEAPPEAPPDALISRDGPTPADSAGDTAPAAETDGTGAAAGDASLDGSGDGGDGSDADGDAGHGDDGGGLVDPGAGCPQDRGPMVRVPAGPFRFGQAGVEIEIPHDYCIDVTEVTVAAFAECVAAGGCEGHASWPLCRQQDERLSPNQCLPGREDFPVNYVDWYRAFDYCAWAGKRLPLGAEWEKAARGEDGRAYAWGDDLDCTRAHVARGVVFDECRDVGGLPNRPAAVGSYPTGASPYGLLDAVGNVKEWIDFRADPTVRPPDGTPAVSRGGSYDEGDWLVTTWWGDNQLGTDLTTQGHGFRCAADAAAR